MSVIEKLERNKGLAFGVVGLLVVVCGIYVISQLRGEDKQADGQGKSYAYFTDDDGATVFADDSLKESPFTHNGREAVKAYCFTTDGNKTHWVGYLERFNAVGKKALDDYRKRKAEDQDPMDVTRLIGNASEVKPPHAPPTEWTKPSSYQKYHAITTPKVPAGQSGDPQPCTPTSAEIKASGN